MADTSVPFKSVRTATVCCLLVFSLFYIPFMTTLSTERRLLPYYVQIKNELFPSSVQIKNETSPSSVQIRNETLPSTVQIKNEPLPSSVQIQNKMLSSTFQIKNKTLSSTLQIKNEPLPSSVQIKNEPLPSSVQIKNETLPSTFQIKNETIPSSVHIKNEPLPSSVQIENKTLPSSVQIKNKTMLRPCRVAVTNSVSFHHETLESIASQLPTKYLHLSSSTCDVRSLVFEYHVLAAGNRVQSWVSYFNSSMQGRDVTHLKARKDPTQKRAIGNLYLHPKLPANGILSLDGHDAYVEASCYCRCFPVPNKRKWPDNINHAEWLSQNNHRTCIFHEECPAGKLENHTRSVWVSPHFNEYYIPSVLPGFRQKPITINRDNPQLCVIGDPRRRDFGLLAHYFQNHTTDRFRVHIYGLGNYSKSMMPYRNVTKMSQVFDYQEFHDKVGRCDGYLALLTKRNNPSYFTRKLTGIIPILLAYKQPAIIHEELYELYKEQLPENVSYETHSDVQSSFADALDRFLDKLQK